METKSADGSAVFGIVRYSFGSASIPGSTWGANFISITAIQLNVRNYPHGPNQLRCIC